jgi:hypothetical protein
MKLIHSIALLFLFNIIPKHTDTFLPWWHKFKNSVTVEIGFLQKQPFTNGHFHFFVIVESVTSQLLNQRPKQIEVQQCKVTTIGWWSRKQNNWLTKMLQAREPSLLHIHPQCISCTVILFYQLTPGTQTFPNHVTVFWIISYICMLVNK